VANIRFEWDEAKNLANQRKHGFSFEQGMQVFRDPLYVSVLDRVVAGEERWQTFGIVRSAILLMVAHTVNEEWEDGDLVERVRVISVRRADSKEKRVYEHENR